MPVTVNVALSDLLDGRLAELVLTGLRRYGLPPEMLQLEIDERVVAQHSDELNIVLRDLDAMGVTLSLDDFGTGYSSLLWLETLPVAEIKIDRAFVSRVGEGAFLGRYRAARSPTWHMRWACAPSPRAWRPKPNGGCCASWAATARRAGTSPPPMAAAQATEWLLAHHGGAEPVLPDAVARAEVAS